MILSPNSYILTPYKIIIYLPGALLYRLIKNLEVQHCMKLTLRWLYIFTLMFLGVAQAAIAQDNGWRRMAVVKFSPSVLFEPRGGYQFGVELPLASNFSVQAEYAHLPYTWLGSDIVWFKPRAGFYASAYKAEARLYVLDRNLISPGHKKYLGKDIQGLYIAAQAQLKKSTSVESAVVANGARTTRTVRYNQQREILKANFKVGYQVILDYGIVIDCYAGAGYRHLTVKNNLLQKDLSREPLFLYNPVSIALGIKAGMAF